MSGTRHIVQALVGRDVVFEAPWDGPTDAESLAAWTAGYRREHPEVTSARIVREDAPEPSRGALVTAWAVPNEELAAMRERSAAADRFVWREGELVLPSTRAAIQPVDGVHSTIGPDGERLLWVDGTLREVHTTREQRAAWPGLPERVYLIEPGEDDPDADH